MGGVTDFTAPGIERAFGRGDDPVGVVNYAGAPSRLVGTLDWAVLDFGEVAMLSEQVFSVF